RLCDAAVTFLGGGGDRNEFTDNVFAGNGAHVRVDGDRELGGARFEGNAFDDYAGFDLDDDGFGDVPYELRALSAELVAHYPALPFFRGRPAPAVTDAAGRLFPLSPPALVMRDARPRMEPAIAPEVPRAD